MINFKIKSKFFQFPTHVPVIFQSGRNAGSATTKLSEAFFMPKPDDLKQPAIDIIKVSTFGQKVKEAINF